ncbi:MAG: peptide-methionine (S)-S-oxide reductase MsrA [Candidatus Obscuribacterales bacterium]|nr:peptide-methionine (S)-S-oxide reductase MsrA [Candidatus Obscuribacterales bacterium]
MEKAYFASGCFWGPEDVFHKIDGVKSTAVGYSGGNYDNPSYQNVCTSTTGHAETVEVEYDPAKVSYEQLLSVFWRIHDPTQVNKQGPDVGTQYRSAIFCTNEQQYKAALASKEAMQKVIKKPIATHIEMFKKFWKAEEYHQQYYAKNGISGGCHL